MKNNKKKKVSQDTQKNASKADIKNIKDIWELLKANKKIILTLAILVFVAYVNIATGDFVTADDPSIFTYVQSHTLNDSLKSFQFHKIYMSVINEIFGLNPTAFHTISIMLHLINTVLAFILVYLLIGDAKKAGMATAIFCVHPVTAEAVAWISGRSYLFTFFFGTITIILFILYRNSKKIDYLVASTMVYLFSLLSWANPWTMVIPFLIVGIDQFILKNKIDVKDFKGYLPVGLSTAIYLGTMFLGKLGQRVSSLKAKYAYDPVSTTPLINRIPYTIFMATRLLIWPIELTIYHEGKLITRPQYAFMVAVTISFFVLLYFLWRKNKTIAALLTLMVLSILPTFSPIIVAWFIAERYLYYSALFFGMIIVIVSSSLEKKKKIKDLSLTVVIILVVFYTVRTILRTNDFRTNKALWLATEKAAPYSRRVYNNLGDVYSKEQNWELAVQAFKRSVELSPNYAEAIHNLGFTYMQMGDLENAKLYLGESFRKNPTIFQAVYKLGLIAAYEGDFTLALAYMDKALEIVPQDQQILMTRQKILDAQAQQNNGPQPTSAVETESSIEQ